MKVCFSPGSVFFLREIEVYVLWFNFILGLIFISHCLYLTIIHYHTPKQKKIKFKPRIKLNHNTSTKYSEQVLSTIAVFQEVQCNIQLLLFFLINRGTEVWTDRCIVTCSNISEPDGDSSPGSPPATGIHQCYYNAAILWWTCILSWRWDDGWRIPCLHNTHVPGKSM